LRVLEVVIAEGLERLGELRRQPVEDVPLAGGTLPVLEAIERLALAIEELGQLLAQLAERLAEVHLPVAAPHLRAQLLEEVVEPHDADALFPLDALVEQPVERLLHVVGEGEVLGQLLEDLIRLEANLLGAVPGGVADPEHGITLPDPTRDENDP